MQTGVTVSGLRQLGWIWVLALTLMISLPASAQSLTSLVGGGQSSESSAASAPSPQELRPSLDQVIATLENSDQRQALLDHLKQLRDVTAADAEQESGSAGLLSAVPSALLPSSRAELGRRLVSWV